LNSIHEDLTQFPQTRVNPAMPAPPQEQIEQQATMQQHGGKDSAVDMPATGEV
jgi:hypothetical protein